MEKFEDVLAHYGIKGMKWGVRRKNPSAKGPEKVQVQTTPGSHVRTAGGRRQPASEDAVRAAVLRRKARASSTDSLSNKELQDLVTRLNLEQQFDRLRPRTATEATTKFITDVLVSVGKDQATRYARDSVGEALKRK